MNTTAELVERLRASGEPNDIEAAATIERLERERDEALLIKYTDGDTVRSYSKACAERDTAQADLTATRAKLADAVEVVKPFARYCEGGDAKNWRRARSFLASMEPDGYD